MTPRLRLLLLLAVTGLLFAAAQSGAASAPAKHQAPGPTVAAADGQQATAARRKHRRRPGCSRFCRQAGGFGGGPPQPNPVKTLSNRVRVASDGLIGIRLRCRLAKTCDGAILVNGHEDYGRADLRIPAHKTRTVLVAVPRKARLYLKRHGGDRTAFATIPLKGNHPVSFSHEFTLLPHR